MLTDLLFRPVGWVMAAHLPGTQFLQDTSIELRTVHLPYEPL